MVLNTPEAVSAFAKGGNVAIGAQLSAAAGPIGRSIGADVLRQAAAISDATVQLQQAHVSHRIMVTAKPADASFSDNVPHDDVGVPRTRH